MHSGTQRGSSTIVFTLILVLCLTALTIAGLSSATSSLRTTQNYRTGAQALVTAEAGLVHAHSRIDQWGVVRFDLDVVPLEKWTGIMGSAWHEVAGHPGVRYSASVEQDPTDPAERLIVRAVGETPDQGTRVVRGRLALGDQYSPGAVYIPTALTNANFDGTAFLIDGTDHHVNGGRNPDGADVPGISTREESSRDAILNGLSANQAERVVGAGGEGSVQQIAGPTEERLQQEIVPGILDLGDGIVDTSTETRLTGQRTFGTVDAPRVTHFLGNVTIGAGNTSGAGIMVVEGSLTIEGTFDFTGLLVVRGSTDLTARGTATVVGAVWTSSVSFNWGGHASVTYSSEAMRMAGNLGAPIPRQTELVAWSED